MTVSPIDLFSDAVRLHDDGRALAGQRSFDPTQAGWQLMAFRAKTDADVHADHWEVHEEAEEVVCCLDGAIRVFFRGQRPGEEDEVKLAAGCAVIVPRGRWHRIELDQPSDILAISVRRGTRLEKRTEA
jgi:mannose-6-phosphate isomerase-like protein (cupin superfamily)